MSSSAVRIALSIVGMAFIALLTMSPFLYRLNGRIPQPIAVIDLMKLTEDATNAISSSDSAPDAKQKAIVDYGVRLSEQVKVIADECQCLVVNKAAVLGGPFTELTAEVQRRMK
jgi:hypothetical protein